MESSLGDLGRFENIWEFPIEDFAVLARPDVQGLYILNPSARFIFENLRAGVSLEPLVDQFASTFDISRELATRDITQTLTGWRSDLLSAPRPSSSQRSAAALPPVSPQSDFFVHTYLIHGKSVRIGLQTSDLADEIAPRLTSIPLSPSAPDFTFRVIEDPDGFSIFCGPRLISKEQFVTEARSVLLQEIVRSSRALDDLAVFHAGACGSNSRCVMFPAATQSGKSTLAAVLMQKGLTLYADDSVILERDTLSVPPMPFGVMIREGSWDVLHPRFPELRAAPIISRYGQQVRFLSPAAANPDTHSARVAAIIFVRFDPSASFEFSSLATLETLLHLQESGFWVAHDEASIREFLRWLETTPAFSMTYSDVDQAASTICDVLA